MLTRKSKYGLKAMLELAEEADRGPVLISELAERQKLPKKFLEAILLELKRHGLLHSKKGKGGGYFLGRKPTDITVGQVIRVLDGPLALTPCVSQTAYRKCDECLRREDLRCPAGDERSARRDRPHPRQHHAGLAQRAGRPRRRPKKAPLQKPVAI